MPTSLTLDTSHHGGNMILRAAGEIDLSNIDAFKQALTSSAAEAAAGGVPLTVDLAAIEYLDSAAINVLYSQADRIRLIANPLLMRGLAISGLSELLTIDSPPR
ncbi:anti-anti-sigma factor [Mycobacterium sp. ACS1612]|uniref:STAS domain-containing protein n=1 Tax=Mycobacterium sp. ACS1612 TaxID=1834117 RepID=UPI0007FF5EEA|nr:STAS domain-containing protein [Mycobacterium sp. ACS1612]OBF30900.1 anti-anti-sigma factor [Mycobacterium sp. ACS1612]